MQKPYYIDPLLQQLADEASVSNKDYSVYMNKSIWHIDVAEHEQNISNMSSAAEFMAS